MAGQRGIVRHHHQRRAFAPVEFEQQFEHLFAGLAVQIAGGLIGQQNRGPRDERARQRNALLLARRRAAPDSGPADPPDRLA